MSKDRVTDTETIAYEIIESNFDNLLRTTPRAIEEFEEQYPKLCDLVSQKVRNQGVKKLGNVFRPGVPDFLGFNNDGSYKFVEVKGEGDGLRHSQLKWLKDFKDLNVEIWFADSNEGITEKMKSDKLNMYSLRSPETKGEKGVEVKEGSRKGFLQIELPETLAAVMDLETGDNVKWNVVDRSKLQLNTD